MSDVMIKVEHATVRYNLSARKNKSLKAYIGAIAHRELLFQEFLAVKDANITVRRGESWGFVGQNGSGKSTLLKVVSGILRPYKGNVQVNGRVAPLLELGAGFDLELTGRENIMMNGLILGMTKKEIIQRFDEIVDFSGVEKFLDVPVSKFSSGMRARLGFSVATCAKPDILIADEVFSTGDKAFREKCEIRMKELLSDGTTLLFVSHNLSMVESLCNKALWLDHGNTRMMGDACDVLPAYDAFMNEQAEIEAKRLAEAQKNR